MKSVLYGNCFTRMQYMHTVAHLSMFLDAFGTVWVSKHCLLIREVLILEVCTHLHVAGEWLAFSEDALISEVACMSAVAGINSMDTVLVQEVS